MSVYRIFVEKNHEFAMNARILADEIRDFLKIPALDNLRIINRYDVEGIDETAFSQCIDTVFTDPKTDSYYFQLRVKPKDYIIGTEYLPGQFDQRADSCGQCIQVLTGGDLPRVRTATIYILSGNITKEEFSSIENYLINPIEKRKARLEAYDSLAYSTAPADKVAILEGFRNMEDKEIDEFLSSQSLAMDREDLDFCKRYFQGEGRDPSLTEIKMIDTYWSDHCRHTTFLTELESIEIEDPLIKDAYNSYLEMRHELKRGNKPITLMDMATIGASYLKHIGTLTSLDESEEINACSVKINVDIDGKTHPWLLMFKNETHNHPTEIEPFGGAATCLGGAIRDPLSGRSYVYQAMRISGASNPLTSADQTLPGKLPQRKIVTGAAAGYSSYGNQIGVPAGIVKEIYHPGYEAKRMEMGAVVAAAPASHVVREAPTPGDIVILLGGKTGRDGCGGATGSSKSHDSSSLEKGGAEVQKGNAPEERKIQRLFRKKAVTRLIKRCNDFGAGGVSVAVGELADSIEINLDAVPVKYPGLDGTELAISESQERMAVVVSANDAPNFIKYAEEENLQATPIAKVTDTGRLIMTWRGEKIVDLSRDFLNSNGAPKYAKVKVAPSIDSNHPHAINLSGQSITTLKDVSDRLDKLLGQLNYCSQKGLVDLFDSTVGGGTVLMPYGGKYKETPSQAMVAKIPLEKNHTNTCSALSWAYNPYLTEANPFKGSYFAVIESIARLVACGGDLNHSWLSFQEYFEKLGDNPEKWAKPFSALLGALKAQKDLGIAAIGGKDSMSGSFEDLKVPPTLLSVSVSLCKASEVISPEFKNAGNSVYLIRPKYDENGLIEKEDLLDCFNTVRQLIKDKKAISAYAISSAGVAEGVFQMSIGNRIGIRLDETFDLSDLFKAYYGGFIVECEKHLRGLDGRAQATLIGTTTKDFVISHKGSCIDLARLRESYNNKLEPIFPTSPMESPTDIPLSYIGDNCNRSFTRVSPISYAKPNVLIPVFPASSGEYDAAKAVESSGGNPKLFIVNNLSAHHLQESIVGMAEEIRKAQIVVLPGGMVCGDEPDGGAKFVTAFLRNERIKEELNIFLEKRLGLMLGIANGFQALVKLGLLPFGHMTEISQDLPAITVNSIGRYRSTLVNTRIVSNSSPWLSGFQLGEIHTMPVSCREGRFVAEDKQLIDLLKNGQLAAQYVDLSGKPTMNIDFNPCGSSMAIEAISSPDGRILGKMGHSERSGPGLYKNIPDAKSQNLFKNAMRYYQY